MESPAEYIAKIEADLRAARAAAFRVEDERNQFKAYAERLAKERNAAIATLEAYEASLRGLAERADIKPVISRAVAVSTAAATAELAIGRLIEAEKIVEAAIKWRTHGEGQSHELHGASANLAQLVDARIAKQETAS